MQPVAVQGRTISFPVEVRRAAAWSASYFVPRERAQQLVPGRLEVAGLGDRAILSLAFVRYDDTDLDAYHEFAVSIAVRSHDAPPGGWRRARESLGGNVRAYIRHLPVDQEFTLEAGRTIWGYPKRLAAIEILDDGATASCTLSEDGRRVLTLSIRGGGLIRMPQRSVPTYSDAGGVLRLTEWDMGGATRGRIGGARLDLGAGVIADELRSLGLPKRALLTTTAQVRAAFGPPSVVG